MMLKIKCNNLEDAALGAKMTFSWFQSCADKLGEAGVHGKVHVIAFGKEDGNLTVGVSDHNEISRYAALTFCLMIRKKNRGLSKVDFIERKQVQFALKSLREKEDGGFRQIHIPDLSNA